MNNENRPIIHLNEMMDNKDLLKKAFNVFKFNYNSTAKAVQGRITTRVINDVIETSLKSYEDNEQKEKFVIEGFYEFTIGMIQNLGDSTKTFKEINNIFHWR